MVIKPYEFNLNLLMGCLLNYELALKILKILIFISAFGRREKFTHMHEMKTKT